jgi:BirA family biotin operon repressor/biotin-[acetyl-CoA-carboxylase] ligase
VSSPYSDLERPPLSERSLNHALVYDGSLWRAIRVVASTPSTNAVLAAEDTDGLVVVAEHQTAGRGRLDRAWESPPRAGLTFSCALRPAGLPDGRWPWLPLCIGVAVAEATESMTGVDVRLKWPNDLLADERKLGGILVERHGDRAVVGIGLNVTTASAELPAPQATSLLLAGARVTDRESLLRAVLRAIDERYLQWSTADDIDDLHAAYVARCSTLGREVTVTLPDGSALRGTANDIDPSGHLLVTSQGVQHALSSGDVLHVRPA